LDQDLKIKLAIQGTAKMGTDFYYIQSEIKIPANQTELSFLIRPITSETIDQDKVVEFFLMESESYDVKESVSARVTITNRVINDADLNGDTAVEFDPCASICAGKSVGNVYLNGDVGMDDVLFLLRKVLESKEE